MSLSAVIIRRKCLRCQNINPQSSIRPKLMFVLLQQMFKVSTICFYASFHRLQKSTTDLQIVRSGKLSQILCNILGLTHFGVLNLLIISLFCWFSTLTNASKIVRSRDVGFAIFMQINRSF